MKLLDYIRGDRKGPQANRIEREAMSDPLLRDAIEGYDSVEGDHEEILRRLEKRIANRSAVKKPRYRSLYRWDIAAALIICIGGTALIYTHRTEKSDKVVEVATLVNLSEDSAVIVAQDLPPIAQKEGSQEVKRFVTPQAESENMEIAAQMESSKIIVTNIDTSMDAEMVIDEAAEAKDEDQETDMDELAVVSFGRARKESVVSAITSERMLDKNIRSLHLTQIEGVSIPQADREKFDAYVKNNLIRPEGVKGELKIRFSTDKSGLPIRMKIRSALGRAAKNESRRLVKNYPDWPASQKNITVYIMF